MPRGRHTPAHTSGSTRVQLSRCHFAVSLPATSILQRVKLRSRIFSTLQRKCVNVVAMLGPQGRPSKRILQVSPGHVSVPGSRRVSAHFQSLLWEGTGLCWGPPTPGESRFSGLRLSWRGSAEKGGLGGLGEEGGYCLGAGVSTEVFILSPPPACKESFILNPSLLLTPSELALCWNGLTLKRDK